MHVYQINCIKSHNAILHSFIPTVFCSEEKQARDCPCEKRLYFLQHKGKDLIDHNKLSLHITRYNRILVQLYKLTLSDGLAEFLSSPLSRLNFGGMILVLKKQNQVHVIRITSKPIRLISKPWWVVLNIKALCLHVAHCTRNLRNLWVRKRSVLPQKIIKKAFLCFLIFSVEWLALLKKNWILSPKKSYDPQ